MGLKVNYTKATTKDEAFNTMKSFVTPEFMGKLQVKTDFHFDDAQKIAKATGNGFTLVIQFLDSHCDVDLDLSLIFRPLKTKILEKI